MCKGSVFYSETHTFFGQDMPNLSTILHCKCIFFAKMLVLLNKFTTFATCFIVKHPARATLKLSQQ